MTDIKALEPLIRAARVQQIRDFWTKHDKPAYFESAESEVDNYSLPELLSELSYPMTLEDGTTLDKVEEGRGGSDFDVWQIVVSVNGGELIGAEGYYSSYEGVTWEYGEVFQMEAYQVTTTEYKRKKG